MLQYPEIPGSSKAPLGKPCIAFYKYDGSNLRFEWTPKRGWYKFGSRTQLINQTDPILGPAIPYFLKTGMGSCINHIVNGIERGVQRVIAFAEWYGPNSFAGVHDPKDIKQGRMELKLIDISLYKQGFMRPRDFVRYFVNDIRMTPWAPQVIYDGNLNQSFIDDVRKGVYPVWEGVVAKGDGWMVKIKTDAYFKKLNEVYGTAYRLYWE